MSTDTDKDRRFLTFRDPFADPVEDGESAVVDYPAGYVSTDFDENGKHYLITTMFGRLLSQDGDFTVTFGTSSATITNESGLTWPASMKCVLELDLLGNTEYPLGVEDGGTGVRRPAFLSYASAVAYDKTGLQYIKVVESGILTEWVRDASGTCLGGGWSPVGRPSPRHWGAPLNGTDDDTTALRAMHTYCNLKNVPPDYSRVLTFSCDADAQIPINTDVDFCGADIKFRSGINPSTPSFSTFRKMFVVADSATPLVAGSDIAAVDADLGLGSDVPTQAFWDEPGFCYIQGADAPGVPGSYPGPFVSNRQGTGLLSYRQAFKVGKEGRCVFPLEVSMVGCGYLYYRARRNSTRGWITIRNISLNASRFNNQVFLRIERNQVKVEQVSVGYADGETIPVSINQLFDMADCCDIILSDVAGVAQTSFSGNGTYICGMSNNADVTFRNIFAGNGWGWQGSSNTSGVYLQNCRVNRFDCHNGGFNMFSTDCYFVENGITVGWGGGILKTLNCTVHDCSLVNSRQDYGSYWFGSFELLDTTIHLDNASSASVVNYETNPIGVAIAAFPMPRSIRIQGVHRTQNVSGNENIIPLRMVVASGATPPVAPSSVYISDVMSSRDGGGGPRIYNVLDLNNMTSPIRVDVNLNNLISGAEFSGPEMAAGATLLYSPAKVGAHTPAELQLSVVNCKNIPVDVSVFEGTPRVIMRGCDDVYRAKGKSGGRFIIGDCGFTAPVLVGVETTSPVGGSRSGTFNFSSMQSCILTGAWDLSNLAMISGLMWPATQDANITLPGAATQATAMSGYRVAF